MRLVRNYPCRNVVRILTHNTQIIIKLKKNKSFYKIDLKNIRDFFAHNEFLIPFSNQIKIHLKYWNRRNNNYIFFKDL